MDPARETRHTSRALVGLIVVFVLLAGSVSIINPLFEASDETRHYRYVRILVTEHRLPVQDTETDRAQSHHPPLYYVLSALLSAWVPSSHDGTFQQPGNPFWGYRNWATGIDNKLQYWHSPDERFPFRNGFLAAMVARWVNVLLGAGTVALTYRLALRALSPRAHDPSATPQIDVEIDDVGPRTQPGRPEDARSTEPLALAAAAIVALNPQFVYQSAAINNDIVAALSGAALLWASIVTLQEGLELRNLVRLGIVSGLALLSKLQVAAIGPAVALSLVFATRPARDAGDHWRRHWLVALVRALLIVGIVAGALCGWWYLRNLRLYGDLTGLRKLDEMWAGRDAGSNLWAIGQGLPQLWASLWGRFGYGQIPLPGIMTTGMLLACAACLSGLVRVRRRRLTSGVFATLALAILGVSAVVGYYMARQPAGAMGRFLFPALPAFAVLLVAGLDAWVQAPARTHTIVTAGMGAFAVVALFGYLWPAVSAPPRKILPTSMAPDPSRPPLQAQVGDVARILSATMDQDEVAPGAAVFVRVNWEPLRWTEEPLVVFVHLIDEAGVVVAQRDTWPGLSRAATTSWRAGIPFVDTYRVDLPETLYSPNTLTVSIGLYGGSAVGRVPIIIDTAAGSTASDSLKVGTLAVTRQDAPWPNATDIDFGDGFHLVGYEIVPRVLAPGETFTLTLIWDVPTAPDTSPHIFAQVLDAEWHVWGSKDGGHPEWQTGIVTETRQITLIPETPVGSYPVNVGLISEGKRLRIVAANGTLQGDFISLGPIGVR